jgi:hypothetical protein
MAQWARRVVLDDEAGGAHLAKATATRYSLRWASHVPCALPQSAEL